MRFSFTRIPVLGLYQCTDCEENIFIFTILLFSDCCSFSNVFRCEMPVRTVGLLDDDAVRTRKWKDVLKKLRCLAQCSAPRL